MGQVAEGAGWMWVTEVQIRRPSRDLHKHTVEPMLREPAQSCCLQMPISLLAFPAWNGSLGFSAWSQK